MPWKMKLALVGACLAGASGAMALAPVVDELMGTRVVKWADLREESGRGGAVRRYFDAPTSTLLRLGLRARTLAPGESPHPVRPHARPVEEILLVKEGTLEVRLDSATQMIEAGSAIQTIEAGSAVFLASNQWHALRNPGRSPVTYYEIDWVSAGMGGERPYWPETAGPRGGPPPRP